MRDLNFGKWAYFVFYNTKSIQKMLSFRCLLINPSKIQGQINYQGVRWIRTRKPFWLGVAKTKMFVIPVPKHRLSREENIELRRLKSEYDLQLNSILNFIKNEDPLRVQQLDKEHLDEDNIDQELEQEMEESFRRNELWNTQSAEFRNFRTQNILQEESKKAEELIIMKEEEKRKETEKIEEIVRQEKIKSQTLITPENLDKAIEECLSTTVEFNFAIDNLGNRIHGKEYLRRDKDQIEARIEVEESAAG